MGVFADVLLEGVQLCFSSPSKKAMGVSALKTLCVECPCCLPFWLFGIAVLTQLNDVRWLVAW